MTDDKNVKKTYTDEKTGKFVKGNPGGGRPKGRKNFETLYRQAIANLAAAEGVTPDEYEVSLVTMALTKSKGGDRPFYSDTLDRVYGKATNTTDITSSDGSLKTVVINKTDDSGDKPTA